MRRPRVPFMSKSDDAILEFLLNDPNDRIRVTPAVIAANIDYARSTINGRLPKLLSAGLIEYYDQDIGIYEITDLGERYLSGDLAAEEIEDLDTDS
jgi:predicted transcriptional regulator